MNELMTVELPPEAPQPWDPVAQVRTKYVRVTNNGDTPFTDRHDGVPVRIDPGQSDNLPLDMAEHFFGYHDDVSAETMFRHVCKRQGWNTPAHIRQGESGKTVAQELFASLDIKPVVYRMVEERVDINEPIPADPQPQPNKVGRPKKVS
jgi:hypothetical protein